MSELISEARMLAALSATNEAVLRAHSSAELFQRVCEAAVDGGGTPPCIALRDQRDARSTACALVPGFRSS